MTRKLEIEESIKGLNHMIDISTEADLSHEQITTLCITMITHQLADISLTLAIIADKLESEGKE